MTKDRRTVQIAAMTWAVLSTCGMAQTRWSVVSPDGGAVAALTSTK